MKLVLNIILNYNSSVPKILNNTSIIEQSQQASLTKCIFSSANVTVTSITAPLTITSSVRLNTASRKKRLTDSIDCENDEQELKAICSNTSQLTKCNQASLNIFLQKFVNKMVIKNLIYSYTTKKRRN